MLVAEIINSLEQDEVGMVGGAQCEEISVAKMGEEGRKPRVRSSTVQNTPGTVLDFL